MPLRTGLPQWRRVALNPADVAGYRVAFSNNNRTIENTDAGYTGTVGYARLTTTFAKPVYFEYVVTSSNMYWVSADIAPPWQNMPTASSGGNNRGLGVIASGDFYSDNLSVYSIFGTPVSGDTICIAVNPVTGKLWARRNNGNWNNSGSDNPATNTGGINIKALGPVLAVSASSAYIGGIFTGNFAVQHWNYTAPAGFGPIEEPVPRVRQPLAFSPVVEDGWDIARASTPSAFQLGNDDRYVTRVGALGTDETIQSKWSKTTGKWYYEILWTEPTGFASGAGFVRDGAGALPSGDYLGATNTDDEGGFNDNDNWNAANAGYWDAPFNDGDILCVSLDLDNDRSWARRNNGSWYGVNSTPGDPATNTGGHVIGAGLTGAIRAIIQLNDPGTRPIATSAFKASQWTYNAPSGFSAPLSESYSDISYTYTSGTGSVVAPAGTVRVKIQAWGGGGGATGGGWGGGGGGYADVRIDAAGGNTVYYSVGAGGIGVTTNSTITASLIGDSSWGRLGTNSRPTSATDGAAAPGGYGGTYEFGSDGTTRIGGSGAGVNTALINDDPALIDVETFVGTTTYNGGSANHASDWEGGGGGAGSGGNGSNSSSATDGIGGAGGSPDGGAGGDGSQTVPTAGTAPGGGGGSSDSSPGGQDGGAGQVKITFTGLYSSDNIWFQQTAFQIWPYVSSGTTYNEDVDEAFALTDAFGGVAAFLRAITESAATSDAFGGTAAFVRAMTESVATSDAYTGTAVFPRSITESVATSDAFTGTMAATGAITESVALTDAPAATLTLSAAIAETMAATDAPSASLTMLGAITESVALTDAPNATAVFTRVIGESVALTDAQAANITMAAAIAESMAATDAFAGGLLFVVAVDESIALTDAQTGLLVMLCERAEIMALSDAQSATASLVVGVTESVALTDAASAVITALGTIAETIATSDTYNGGSVYAVSINESVGIADSQSVLVTLFGSVQEALALSDTSNTTLVAVAVVAETIGTLDTYIDQSAPPTTDEYRVGGGSVQELLQTLNVATIHHTQKKTGPS